MRGAADSVPSVLAPPAHSLWCCLYRLLILRAGAWFRCAWLGSCVTGHGVRDDWPHQHVPHDSEHPEHLRRRGVALHLQGGRSGEFLLLVVSSSTINRHVLHTVVILD